MTLSNDQQQALFKLKIFIESDDINNRQFVLKGAAGVGKTYVLTKLRKENNNYFFQYLAPTHKAKQVLEQNGEHSAKTFHSFFCYEKMYDEEGNSIFEANKKRWKSVSSIKDRNVIIIDESSMLKDNECKIISEYLEKYHLTKVIYVGDHFQLPPVQFDSSMLKTTSKSKSDDQLIMRETKVFNSNYRESIITETMRTKSLAIINVYNTFRNYVSINNFEKLLIYISEIQKQQNNYNNIKIFTDKKLFLENFFEKYIKNNSSYLITCSNNSVIKYNENVKKYLFNPSIDKKLCLKLDQPIDQSLLDIDIFPFPFVTNERVIFTNYFKFKKLCNRNYCRCDKVYNSQEVTITNHYIGNYKSELFDKTFIVFIFETDYICNNSKKCLHIRRIHPISKKEYKLSKEKYKRIIKESNNKIHKQQMWVEFYKECANIETPFTEAYSMTVYKSQGSTYQNVYVDMENIVCCRKDEFTRSRELYTAVTRASNYLAIYIGNYIQNVDSGKLNNILIPKQSPKLTQKYNPICTIQKCNRCKKKQNIIEFQRKNKIYKSCNNCSIKYSKKNKIKKCMFTPLNI